MLHIAVKYGISSGKNCLTMVVGTGSSAHDFEVPLTMTLRTSSDEHSSKWSSTAAAGGRTVVGSVFPVEFRTEATFSLK